MAFLFLFSLVPSRSVSPLSFIRRATDGGAVRRSHGGELAGAGG
jgi:hypothetical protein